MLVPANALLALSEGGGIVKVVIQLIGLGIIFGLLWYLLDYVALKEPINKVARVLLVLAAVIILIYLVAEMTGLKL